MRADENWRDDPKHREVVKKQLERESAAFKKARALLDEASRVLCTGPASNELYARSRNSVELAKHHLERDAKYVESDRTETYIGNLAAFGVAFKYFREGDI